MKSFGVRLLFCWNGQSDEKKGFSLFPHVYFRNFVFNGFISRRLLVCDITLAPQESWNHVYEFLLDSWTIPNILPLKKTTFHLAVIITLKLFVFFCLQILSRQKISKRKKNRIVRLSCSYIYSSHNDKHVFKISSTCHFKI